MNKEQIADTVMELIEKLELTTIDEPEYYKCRMVLSYLIDVGKMSDGLLHEGFMLDREFGDCGLSEDEWNLFRKM